MLGMGRVARKRKMLTQGATTEEQEYIVIKSKHFLHLTPWDMIVALSNSVE
jgi:hypothetical protein